MTYAEIIKNAIPEADDALIDHIVWGRTPFPFKQLSAKELYRAAHRFSRACKHKVTLCEFCNHIAEIEGLCKKCHNVLSNNRERYDK